LNAITFAGTSAPKDAIQSSAKPSASFAALLLKFY